MLSLPRTLGYRLADPLVQELKSAGCQRVFHEKLPGVTATSSTRRVRAPPGEGRKRAKPRGVLFGRPFKLAPHQRREAIARREGGDETLTDIARSYNVSHSTISRLR